jgi:hypothetical protein
VTANYCSHRICRTTEPCRYDAEIAAAKAAVRRTYDGPIAAYEKAEAELQRLLAGR